MASPTELDIFTRSLGGEHRARTELYKKYVHGNPRVCRLANGSSQLRIFLHDCFNNLLRTGHSWDSSESLSDWVESVALWTALVKSRHRDMHARGAKGEIRMCAEMEGEGGVQGEVLAAYGPPLLGAEDSPSSRVFALLSDTEKVIYRKRVLEGATWQETAEAAGKPLNAVGQIFARTIGRIARLFGAPAPMDYDLLDVISRVFAEPTRPEGRAISMQLDGAFYVLTPELRAIGVNTANDARIVVLWDTAQQSTPPGDALRRHLDKCPYCTDMLRALLLMQQAMLCPPGGQFHLCPGAFTLSNSPDMVRETFDQHLALCSICREERTQLLDGLVPRSESETAESGLKPGSRKTLIWAVAAVLLVALGSFAGYRLLRSHKPDVPAATLLSENPQATVTVDPRYRDLVQDVPFDDVRVLASVLPANRPAMKFALDQFTLGQASQALSVSAKVAGKGNDPGAQMIYAMSLYGTMLMTDAYREMLKAESMAPRDSLRCWIMLQFALKVGDRPEVEREVQHLSTDPAYGDRAKKILDTVKARG